MVGSIAFGKTGASSTGSPTSPVGRSLLNSGVADEDSTTSSRPSSSHSTASRATSMRLEGGVPPALGTPHHSPTGTDIISARIPSIGTRIAASSPMASQISPMRSCMPSCARAPRTA